MATQDKKTTATKTTVKKPVAKKEKAPGVGSVACQLIENGDKTHAAKAGQFGTFMTNQEILDAVLKQFPQASTKLASINWYRNDLRTKGKKVPQNREIVKARKSSEVKDTANKGAAAVTGKKTTAKKSGATNLV